VIVVDASAVVETLLRLPTADKVDAWILDSGETMHAPHLLDAEVMHAMRRFDAVGKLDRDRARIALGGLIGLPIRRYPHRHLLPRVWELRHALTAYDAVYVALAEVLDAPLLTRDRRLANAKGHHARIELI
jgi:predicted nucleic acid-binding protein